VTAAVIAVLSALSLAAIVLSPEIGPDVQRLRRPLTRRRPAPEPPAPEHPVYGRYLETAPDTHAVRHDGVITAAGGSVTVTPAPGMIEPMRFPRGPRHAVDSLPRRFKERQPGTEWTAAQPAVRP
jgi:hypothetical protein